MSSHSSPLKLLIVDDSLSFRRLIALALKGQDEIDIVGESIGGEEALSFLQHNKVDVITLDMEMPGLNGLETVIRIQNIPPPRPGIILLSRHTKRGSSLTVNALEAGAFDFITKPDQGTMEENVESLRRQILIKSRTWKVVHQSKIPSAPQKKSIPPSRPAPTPPQVAEVLLIGCSTGGPKALMEVMPKICRRIQIPILIVQHMPPTFTRSLAESLDRQCPEYDIVEGEAGMALRPQLAIIAPGGHHMIVRHSEAAGPSIVLTDQPPEHGCRPAVDVLFRSAAKAFKSTVSVILTGMGSDGTRGLRPLVRLGHPVIAQDEASSVVWGMPGSAVQAGLVSTICSLENIPHNVVKYCHRSSAQ